MHYQAWGATWLTGIAAWIACYSYISSNNAVSNGSSTDTQFAEKNMIMYYVSVGTVVAVGTAAVVDIIQMIRYLYTANRGSTPIIRPGSN
jgi:hypothetical protein